MMPVLSSIAVRFIVESTAASATSHGLSLISMNGILPATVEPMMMVLLAKVANEPMTSRMSASM